MPWPVSHSMSIGNWRRGVRHIFELAGESFNIASPKQLSEILFDKLQPPTLKRNVKTKTASTAVEVLEELALTHDLPRQILEWRALQKLKGTYIDALPQLVNPETGRVHTSFNQAVAATGRLSSSDPNLQNIPIRTELGREIRARVHRRARPRADLRRLFADRAARAGAPVGRRDADRGFPARRRHPRPDGARRCSGRDSALDQHELRRRAKIINYALLYGKTAFTLAKDIGVTPQAAQEFIDAYFAGFPRVRAFIDRRRSRRRETAASSRRCSAGRRLVPELNSRNGQIRSAAERVAVNLPIQGTAADIMKRGYDRRPCDARRRIRTRRMILTVHDELLFEVPENRAEEVAASQCARPDAGRGAACRILSPSISGSEKNWKDANELTFTTFTTFIPGSSGFEALRIPRRSVSGGCPERGPVQDEGRQHEPIEIGPQRRSSIAEPLGPAPIPLAPLPTRPEDPLPAGGHRNPVKSGRAGGNRAQLALHPLRECVDTRPGDRTPFSAAHHGRVRWPDQSSTRSCSSSVKELGPSGTESKTPAAAQSDRREYSVSPGPDDDIRSVREHQKRCGSESAQALTGAVEIFRLGPVHGRSSR